MSIIYKTSIIIGINIRVLLVAYCATFANTVYQLSLFRNHFIIINNYSGAPGVIKFVYLCIQEIFVVTKSRERSSVRSSVRPYVSGMWNVTLSLRGPRNIQSVNLNPVHLCQLRMVQKGYPQTIVTWLYRELKCGRDFFKGSPLTTYVFN